MPLPELSAFAPLVRSSSGAVGCPSWALRLPLEAGKVCGKGRDPVGMLAGGRRCPLAWVGLQPEGIALLRHPDPLFPEGPRGAGGCEGGASWQVWTGQGGAPAWEGCEWARPCSEAGPGVVVSALNLPSHLTGTEGLHLAGRSPPCQGHHHPHLGAEQSADDLQKAAEQ